MGKFRTKTDQKVYSQSFERVSCSGSNVHISDVALDGFYGSTARQISTILRRHSAELGVS